MGIANNPQFQGAANQQQTGNQVPAGSPPPPNTQPNVQYAGMPASGVASGNTNINDLAMSGLKLGMADVAQAGGYRPEQVQAGQMAGQDLSAYTNPYEDQVVQQTTDDMLRAQQMQQNVMDQQMGAAGAFGGSRHGIAQAESNRGFYDRLGAAQGQMRQQGFQNAQNQAQQDLQRQYSADVQNQSTGLQAAQNQGQMGVQLANLGNLGFGMGQTVQKNLQNQGNVQQLMNQQLIDAAKGQFAGYTGRPEQTIGYLSNALGATTVPTSTTTEKQVGLMDYLSLGANVAGAAAASDIRLKTNIEKVGELANGLNLYTWDWTKHAKDNDLAGDMHFGVMAQEVEQIDPSLVVEMSNGYKAVKYNELLRTVQ